MACCMHPCFSLGRVVKFWRTKNPATMLSAYKMDLQHITDKKWPKPVLEFIFKIKFKRVRLAFFFHFGARKVPRSSLILLAGFISDANFAFLSDWNATFEYPVNVVWIDVSLEIDRRALIDWPRNIGALCTIFGQSRALNDFFSC